MQVASWHEFAGCRQQPNPLEAVQSLHRVCAKSESGPIFAKSFLTTLLAAGFSVVALKLPRQTATHVLQEVVTLPRVARVVLAGGFFAAALLAGALRAGALRLPAAPFLALPAAGASAVSASVSAAAAASASSALTSASSIVTSTAACSKDKQVYFNSCVSLI